MFGKLVKTLAAGAALMLAAAQANATLVQIDLPAEYTGITNHIDIDGLDLFSDYTSITDGSMTVSFSSSMNARSFPGGGWGTWSGAPFSEGTPTGLLYSNGATAMTFSFSSLINIFGVEIEPNPFSTFEFTMEFFNGATSVGSITRMVDGSSGARVLGAISDMMFDRVVISSSVDWAVGHFRYGTGEIPVAEPEALALLGLGLLALMAQRRRRA